MHVTVKFGWLALPIVLLWANPGHSVEIFQTAFTAEFVLKARGTLVGRSKWSLTSTQQSVVYELESNTAGIAVLFSKDHIVERSEWRPHGNALKPYGYQYERSGGKKEKHVTVDFRWDDDFVINTSRGESWQMPIPGNAIDKLSYVIAMMHDLSEGQRVFEYLVADGGKLKTYTLESIGDEMLKTKIGTVDTVKVLRRRSDSKRETTFWCAPLYQYLPVKIEHRAPAGEVLTGYLESVTGLVQETASSLLPRTNIVKRAD